MIKALSLLLLLSSIQVNSQTIFEYERDINDKESYFFKEIEFRNPDDNIKLSGTLITPKSTYEKLIILVPGSGKDTRYSHPKLTEFLLRNNIAVYRFDERGIGKSEGDYSTKVTPLINDLRFCITHLRSINAIKGKKFGVLGHSLGGMASIAISEANPGVEFFIQMSTPVNAGQSFKKQVSKIDILKVKNKSIEETEHLIDTFNYVIRTTNKFKKIQKRCARITRKLDFPNHMSNLYINPQFVDMIKNDTEYYYKNNNKPTLFIIGKEDDVVDVVYGIEKLRSFENKMITLTVLETMDHYLTTNNGEWRKINKSELRDIDDNAANEIIRWIKNNT